MGKEVREKNPLFVAPPRGFDLSLWRDFHAEIKKYYPNIYTPEYVIDVDFPTKFFLSVLRLFKYLTVVLFFTPRCTLPSCSVNVQSLPEGWNVDEADPAQGETVTFSCNETLVSDIGTTFTATCDDGAITLPSPFPKCRCSSYYVSVAGYYRLSIGSLIL